MIKRLQKRFIILATISTVVLMTVLVTVMNLLNLSTVIFDTDEVLDVISQPDAPFFDKDKRADTPEPPENEITDDDLNNTFIQFMPVGMSPEVPYESRFFSVEINEDGEVINTDRTQIISVDDETAAEYAKQALNNKFNRGFIGNFRYSKTTKDGVTNIIFLDCGRKLAAYRSFMWISIASGFTGCVIVFIIFLLVAKRIVRPISESYDKQKRFITDAGHEIKTPLTIISANADLLELDVGENESLTEIRVQTKRLTELTKELVFLSKMEEANNNIPKVEFPVSDLMTETAQQFKAVAKSKNTQYSFSIEPNVSMIGYPDDIRKLTNILLDNAIKYSPENGVVKLIMNVQKKMLSIIVFNTTTDLIDKESLNQVFERFYRTDKSRNSETGGHGIGLSVARAIVDSCNGNIFATTETGNDFSVTVNIPL